MIRIQQLKLHTGHSEAQLEEKIRKTLRIREGENFSYRIVRRSLDARKKPELFYVYTVDVSTKGEKALLRKNRNKHVQESREVRYSFPEPGSEKMHCRPVVAGFGPAGLFAAYMLALHGYRPVVVERGMDALQRKKDVETFWETGVLDVRSNVQFGEGGAGTFSDGKLNTLVKDKYGRNRKVLEILCDHGAPEEIAYDAKPHIGTDLLIQVVTRMREEIIRMGGQVCFHTQLVSAEPAAPSGRDAKEGSLSLVLEDTLTGKRREETTQALILAIGHSARDTFAMLRDRGVPMEAKSFAVGVRAEHPQSMIDADQYGTKEGADRPDGLPAAAYKLTCQLPEGRGVYTFCMCPGGYVVNASSEEGRVAVNGMSYHDRAGRNANSAVIVTVTPEDFGGEDPLAGVEFQRKLEERACQAGQGKVPVQLFGDFCRGKISERIVEVKPQIKGGFSFGDVRGIFPEEIGDAIERGIREFGRKLPGYDREDAVLSGVESRTSSPVRILRNEGLESSLRGLYPCGEGAGYAGGIMSAAMDGMKVAEAVARKYRPFDKDAND